MKAPQIFISYSHEDHTIATELSNLLQQAFGLGLTDVFVDRSSISFGGGIKDSINKALDNADILIAITTTAQPASVLSWPGYEIGRFLAGWDHSKHGDRERGKVIGQVAVLCNGSTSFGPQTGNRPVNLGFSEELLSSTEAENVVLAKAVAHNELLQYLTDIEDLLRSESAYDEFFRSRQRTLPELAGMFRARAFHELKRRVRDVSKPSKQLVIRYNLTTHANQEGDLPDDAKVTSAGGASDIFGKHEGNPTLFARVLDPITGNTRFETTWGDFKNSVANHDYGSYWCGVLARAATAATTEGTQWDQNLVLVSARNQRHRVISTTVTTYFNNDAEVSLYLIEALQRQDHGDPDTTKFLTCLNMVCRFRFAFLEEQSPYYWMNFHPKETDVKVAWALLMELDFLKSEARNANIDQPGAWEEFMSTEQMNVMLDAWTAIERDLRAACNAALGREASVEGDLNWKERVSIQLQKINNDIRPFNTLLGSAISARLTKHFDKRRMIEGGNSGEQSRSVD